MFLSPRGEKAPRDDNLPERQRGRLAFEVVTTRKGFLRLEDEWDALYEDCHTTPFQSWAWLYSWWEYFGEHDMELRLVLVKSGSRLVGVLPLMLSRSRKMNRLLLVGNGPTSYLDILVRRGWQDEVAAVLEDVLDSIPDWHVADFQQLRRDSAFLTVLEGWSGPSVNTRHEDCLVLETSSWEDLVKRPRKSQRTQSRKTIRRAYEDGLSHRRVPPGETEEAAGTLVKLSREYWRDRWRETSPEHWSREFEDHLKAVTRRVTGKGLGAISEVRGEEEGVVLPQLLFFGESFTADYMVAPKVSTLRHYSFNTLFIYYAMKVAAERGSRQLSLMRGSEDYKWRWSPEVEPNRRVILGKNRARWALYAAQSVLRIRLSDYAKSESSPSWLSRLLERGERLQSEREWKGSPEIRKNLEGNYEV